MAQMCALVSAAATPRPWPYGPKELLKALDAILGQAMVAEDIGEHEARDRLAMVRHLAAQALRVEGFCDGPTDALNSIARICRDIDIMDDSERSERLADVNRIARAALAKARA